MGFRVLGLLAFFSGFRVYLRFWGVLAYGMILIVDTMKYGSA